MKSESLSFSTANGDTISYVAIPDVESKKAVVVIQEWWGLNEHIKDIANRYAAEGFIAIAPDLYRGKVASNPDEASKMMNALEIEDGIDTIRNAVAKARDTYGLSHFGITGFCMGGTYALRAACELEGFRRGGPVLRRCAGGRCSQEFDHADDLYFRHAGQVDQSRKSCRP